MHWVGSMGGDEALVEVSGGWVSAAGQTGGCIALWHPLVLGGTTPNTVIISHIAVISHIPSVCLQHYQSFKRRVHGTHTLSQMADREEMLGALWLCWVC